MNITTLASVSACAVVAAASSASGALTTVNPGYVSGSTHFEARMRVDAGNSQTWKAALWQGGNNPQASNGVKQNLWNDGQTYNFELTFSAADGATSLTVFDLGGADQVAATTLELDAGDTVAGFRYYSRSQGNGIGSTTLSGLNINIDGTDVALADLSTGVNEVWKETNNFFFTDPNVQNIAITGSITFDWLDTLSGNAINQNLKDERFKAGFYFLSADGSAVPAPGAAALAGLAGVAALRRKRA